MTYKGKVVGGRVVLEGAPDLPEGAVVRVETVAQQEAARPRKKERALSEKLLQWAGTAKGLPSDLALQHDHYLYGRPKR